MTNSSMLKQKIQDSGLVRAWILKQLGIKSYATLRAKIDNKSNFTASEINTLCEILNISKSQREAIFFAKSAE